MRPVFAIIIRRGDEIVPRPMDVSGARVGHGLGKRPEEAPGDRVERLGDDAARGLVGIAYLARDQPGVGHAAAHLAYVEPRPRQRVQDILHPGTAAAFQQRLQRLLAQGVELARAALEHLQVQPLLADEVVQHQRRRHACGPRDVADGYAVQAEVGEQLLGLQQDRVPLVRSPGCHARFLFERSIKIVGGPATPCQAKPANRGLPDRPRAAMFAGP
jgi:hypothetical protein